MGNNTVIASDGGFAVADPEAGEIFVSTDDESGEREFWILTQRATRDFGAVSLKDGRFWNTPDKDVWAAIDRLTLFCRKATITIEPAE